MNTKIGVIVLASYSLLFSCYLAGCASQTYKPYYAGKILTVSFHELDHYWKYELKASNSNTVGCFKVEMTIDSNGRIVSPTFIKQVGPSSPKSWLLDFLSEQRYTPASTNPSRIPVRTTGEWALFSGDMSTQRHAVEALNNSGECFDALNVRHN